MTGRALDHPGTSEALARYRSFTTRWGVGSALALVAGVVLPFFGVEAGRLVAVSLGGGVVATWATARAGVLASRMETALGDGPWKECGAVFLPNVWGRPAVALCDRASGTVWTVSPHVSGTRAHPAAPGPSGVLWWCGDTSHGGVMSRPGGTGPARTGPAAARLLRRAAAAGVCPATPAPRPGP